MSAATNTWSPPRTTDGQPDIQGFWSAGGDATGDNIEVGTVSNVYLGRTFKATHMIVDPPDHKIPYQPWAAARRNAMVDRQEHPKPSELDPIARCYLPGVPRQAYLMSAMQILQASGYVTILSEVMHTYRIVPLDQRPHPGDRLRLWMGDSRGHWEDRTLVVDVANSNDQTWLDTASNFHSDALHVVERWTYVDADTIAYEATLEDPAVYTKPFKIAFPLVRNKQKHYELLEFACHEGDRSEALMIRPLKPVK